MYTFSAKVWDQRDWQHPKRELHIAVSFSHVSFLPSTHTRSANPNRTTGDEMISLEYAPPIFTRSARGHTTGIPDEQRTMTQLTHGCHKYQCNGC
jgi:hypothetical protein